MALGWGVALCLEFNPFASLSAGGPGVAFGVAILVKGIGKQRGKALES